jgi:hypothetical protein
MSCHRFEINGVRGILTLPNVYEYGGFIFEYHAYLGPTKLKKNLEFAQRQGIKFFNSVGEWEKLSKKEKEKTRISG